MAAKKKPLLIEANDMIHGKRRMMYGSAELGMQKVADQWNLYIGQKYGTDHAVLTPEDVCWLVVKMKMVRQMHSQKRDNVVDAAGYIGLIDEVI